MTEDRAIGGEPGTTEQAPQELWLEQLRAGNRSGFERLYRQHAGRVNALCLRMTGQNQVAEEMTQEVFLRAWQKRATFKQHDHFRAWLNQVALNLIRNERRTFVKRSAKIDRIREAVPEEEDGRGYREPTAFRTDLERAIAALPPGAREALLLHDVHGYKHEEIARMSGKAVGTIKAQLHRARKRLRQTLGQESKS